MDHTPTPPNGAPTTEPADRHGAKTTTKLNR